MSIARFEVMRAATDPRNTVWAAALAATVRSGEDARSEVSAEVVKLIESGDLMLAHTVWTGDTPRTIARQAADDALTDESQWHPRRLPWAKRLRLYATEDGAARFRNGEFGVPAPMARPVTNVAEMLELQALTCSEAMGMAASVAGFLLGGGAGYLVGSGGVPRDFTTWSLSGLVGWIFGGLVGMSAVLHLWRKAFPAEESDALPETVIPDQFNEGPDVNNVDPFGDPRF